MTALLYKAAPLSVPFRTNWSKLHRLILCSSSSSVAMGGSSAPEPWHTLVSQQGSSEARRMQAKRRLLITGVDQDELVDPWLLADADSRFAELHGVHIHYKIADPTCIVEEEGKRDDGLGLASESPLSSSPSLSSTSSVASSSALSPASSLSSSSSLESLQTSSSTGQSHPLSSSSSTMLPNAPSSNSVTSPAAPSSSPSDAKPLSSSSSSEASSPIQRAPSSHIPAILLHGFGASLFSWERVLRPLAKVLRSQAIAFDRPAFGLTTRIEVPVAYSATRKGDLPVNPYSVSFSSNATIAFIDFLQSKKAVLIGHSAGCIVAADAYFKAPERIAAIIMVAPALVAPISLFKKVEKRQKQNMLPQVILNIWAKIVSAFSIVGAVARALVSAIKLLWYRLLAAVLRSGFGRWVIRLIMDKLSLKAVRLAWYDKAKVDDYVIAGYTKPLKCRDWEHALLEYVIAVAGSPSSDDNKNSLSKRVGEIKCPVLVITGDSDFIVPAWNAERVAKVLPNAQCHVIKNCGHLPQEEKPEEFLNVIQQFMQQVQQGATTERTPDGSMVFMPA